MYTMVDYYWLCSLIPGKGLDVSDLDAYCFDLYKATKIFINVTVSSIFVSFVPRFHICIAAMDFVLNFSVMIHGFRY